MPQKLETNPPQLGHEHMNGEREGADESVQPLSASSRPEPHDWSQSFVIQRQYRSITQLHLKIQKLNGAGRPSAGIKTLQWAFYLPALSFQTQKLEKLNLLTNENALLRFACPFRHNNGLFLKMFFSQPLFRHLKNFTHWTFNSLWMWIR